MLHSRIYFEDVQEKWKGHDLKTNLIVRVSSKLCTKYALCRKKSSSLPIKKLKFPIFAPLTTYPF